MKAVWVYLILIIASLWAMFIPARHALHMFQQNRYETGRYGAWIKDNLRDSAKSAGVDYVWIALACISSVSTNGVFRVFFCLILLVLYALFQFHQEKKKTYIKPLVVTARVKRQIVVLCILEVLILFLIIKTGVYFLLIVCAVILPWILIYPTGWITAPIEKTVQQSYINDAKRILNEHDNLIKIGITGSYGKTTTKNIMQSIIGESYSSLMTPASYNTPMGITRTIREQLKPIHQVFICEMGADHVGDITELMNFVHPSIGVVTSIGPQHLNTFGSQENIIHEKMQMIELLPENGLGILNWDNEFIRGYQIHNRVKTVTYGIQNKDADYLAEDIQYTNKGSSFTIVHGEERIPMETKLLGELNILNILSAAAAARYLKIDWSTIQRAVKLMKPVEHRLEPKMINGLHFIDDAFNANPTGSSMALEVLGRMNGRRMIVTPGMIDLGEKQYEINYHFGTLMKGKADIVILVGKEQTKPIYEGLRDSGYDMDQVIVLDKEKEAFAYLWQTASGEDTILLENDLPDAFNH